MITHDVIVTVRKTPPGERPFDIDAGARGVPKPEELRPGISPTTWSTRWQRGSSASSTRSTTRSTSSRTTSRTGRRSGSARGSPTCATTSSTCAARSPRRATRSARSSTTASSSTADGALPRELELDFADAYDKLLRATDGLELARDLGAGVRDYLQAKVSNDQNEVMKRLTMIASLMLLPTFIVGLYGQNFVQHPGAPLALRLPVRLAPDHRHDDRPARLLPPEEVDVGA